MDGELVSNTEYCVYSNLYIPTCYSLAYLAADTWLQNWMLRRVAFPLLRPKHQHRPSRRHAATASPANQTSQFIMTTESGVDSGVVLTLFDCDWAVYLRRDCC